MKSTSHAPERILAYGLYGSGKTHGWATIASYYRRTDTPGTFYVISCEHGTVDRLRDGYPASDDDPGFDSNVTYDDVHNWSELTKLTDMYLANAVDGDWLVIEGVDKPWQFIQQLWHQTKGTIGDQSDPFALQEAGEVDWVKVNAVYRAWIIPILQSPAHVYACAPQDAVRVPTGKPKEWADNKQTVEQFARFGYKPAGQKDLGFQFHTVLYMQNPRRGVYTVTSVDDHTRDLLEDHEVNPDFVLGYLVPTAHWSL
jgi:hypothetical protein